MTNEQITERVKALLNCPTDSALADCIGLHRRSISKFKRGEGHSVACSMLAKVLTIIEQPLTAETEQPDTQ